MDKHFSRLLANPIDDYSFDLREYLSNECDRLIKLFSQKVSVIRKPRKNKRLHVNINKFVLGSAWCHIKHYVKIQRR